MVIGTAAALLGGAALGAGASILGSSKAANAQKDSAASATAAQRQMFDITQQNLQPYNQTGQNALQKANALAGTFNFDPTMAQISQTPGFQFENYFGQKAVNNAAAAKGLANSGAALKGAANYATGLAGTNWQNYFNAAQQQYQTNLGGLQNIANLGENAAAGVGNAATQTGGQIGNNIIGAGNAQAAAYNTAAGGVNNAIGTGVGGYLTNNLIQGMYGPGTSASTAANNASYEQLQNDLGY